eukprot:1149010-Pyramimonas_sp.AAC.1
MDLSASREATLAVKSHESLVGFFNERTANKPQSKNILKSSKDLVYHRESEDVKSSLRLARQHAWGKLLTVNAAIPIGPVELQRMSISVERVDLVAPHYKSRFVVRGDPEESLGIRADLPTCELE